VHALSLVRESYNSVVQTGATLLVNPGCFVASHISVAGEPKESVYAIRRLPFDHRSFFPHRLELGLSAC
jgi:hypothetical protein